MIWLSMLFVACHAEKEKGLKVDHFGGLDVSADPLSDISGLPSLSSQLNPNHCDEISAELQVPGATSYFTGTYVLDNGSWIGREKWILFANEHWVEAGGETCEVVWDMTATETSLETCLACDLALFVDAEIHEGSTTCPPDLWSHEEEQVWNETYEIAVIGEETLFQYQDGKVLGEGYANERAYSFLSDPDCKWF